MPYHQRSAVLFVLLLKVAMTTVVLPACRVAFCVSGYLPDNVPVSVYSTLRTFVVESMTRLGPDGRQRCTGEVFLYMIGSDGIERTPSTFQTQVQGVKNIFEPELVDAKALDELPPPAFLPHGQEEEVSLIQYRALYPQYACFKLVEREEHRQTKLKNDTALPPFHYRWVVHLDFQSFWLGPVPSLTHHAFAQDRVYAPADWQTTAPMPLRFAIVPRNYAKVVFYSVTQGASNMRVLTGITTSARQEELGNHIICNRLQDAGIPVQQATFAMARIRHQADQPGSVSPTSAIQCSPVGVHKTICAVLQADEMLLPECSQLVLQSYGSLCTSMAETLILGKTSSVLPILSLRDVQASVERAGLWLHENIQADSSLYVDIVVVGKSNQPLLKRVAFSVANVLLMMDLLLELLSSNDGQRRLLHSENAAAAAVAEKSKIPYALFVELHSIESTLWRQLINWQELLLRLNEPAETVWGLRECIGDDDGRINGSTCNNKDIMKYAAAADGETDIAYWAASLPSYCPGYGVGGLCAPIVNGPPAESERGTQSVAFTKPKHKSTLRFVMNVTLLYDEPYTASNLRDVLMRPSYNMTAGHQLEQEVPFMVHRVQEVSRAISDFCRAHTSTHLQGCIHTASTQVLEALHSDIESESLISSVARKCAAMAVDRTSVDGADNASTADKTANPFQIDVLPWQMRDHLVTDGLTTNMYDLLQRSLSEGSLLDLQNRTAEMARAEIFKGAAAFTELISTWEAPSLHGLPASIASFFNDSSIDGSVPITHTLDGLTVTKILVFGLQNFPALTEDWVFDHSFLMRSVNSYGIGPGIASILCHRLGSVMSAQGMYARAVPWLNAAIELQIAAEDAVDESQFLWEFANAVALVGVGSATVPSGLLDLAAGATETLLTLWKTNTTMVSKYRMTLHIRALLYIAAGDSSAAKTIYRTMHSQFHYNTPGTLEPSHPMHPDAPPSTKAAYVASHSLLDLPLLDKHRLQGVESSSLLDVQASVESYARRKRPFLLHNVTTGWAAVEAWSFDKIGETLGEEAYFFSEWNSSDTLASLVTSRFFNTAELSSQFDMTHILGGRETSADDIAGIFAEHMGTTFHKFLVFSQPGAGVTPHKDGYELAGWNCCVRGRKRWWVSPPWTPKQQHQMSMIMPLHQLSVLPAGKWFEEVLPLVKQIKGFEYYEFMQGAGDIVILPPGWMHVVLSLEQSSTVTFNTINEFTVEATFSAYCQRTRWSLGYSLKACTVLREIRPDWFARTCCPEFLRRPSAFPVATLFDEAAINVHLTEVADGS
jgi:hypothetical protein